MLTIILTPTALRFKGLSDELHAELSKDYLIEETRKGHAIKGEPTELFKTLLKLSYTYDIEIY